MECSAKSGRESIETCVLNVMRDVKRQRIKETERLADFAGKEETRWKAEKERLLAELRRNQQEETGLRRLWKRIWG
jgi:hypothetical protein